MGQSPFPSLAQLAGQPVIIGAGIAGLATALFLAPMPVVVLNKGKFNSGATGWAQGGIAAAIGSDDSPDFHSADTIAVGGGLVDPAIAQMVAEAAPSAVERLQSWGMRFDCNADGSFATGREAGHSRARIMHAGGDATGHAIMIALMAEVRRTPSITLLENTTALAVLNSDNRVAGVAIMHNGETAILPAGRVVIATGGIGQLYRHTTNPPGANGDGLMLAARAGAVLKNMEFVQFHPTAMALGRDPMPLATEALRGQGARLVTLPGHHVMEGFPAGDLSPRDIVARAIWYRLQEGEKVFLDCRGIGEFAQRFPTVFASCKAADIDPSRELIPVRPAAHYHMGGVEVDAAGLTLVDGLWACGEVACTGLHGANRLASNSLLEAIVFAEKIAQSIRGLEPTTDRAVASFVPPDNSGQSAFPLRDMMDRHAGVMRDAAGLATLINTLEQSFRAGESGYTLAYIIARAALQRQESRGAQYRTDFPDSLPDAVHSRFKLATMNGLPELQELRG